MAECAVQDLLDQNPCLVELSDHQLSVIIVQMLCNLKGNLEDGDEITCDIQTLLDQGKCFDSMDDFRLKIVQAQLLCDISQLV